MARPRGVDAYPFHTRPRNGWLEQLQERAELVGVPLSTRCPHNPTTILIYWCYARLLLANRRRDVLSYRYHFNVGISIRFPRKGNVTLVLVSATSKSCRSRLTCAVKPRFSERIQILRVGAERPRALSSHIDAPHLIYL